MRRSKSNPAKYAKNYRSISQRRMTEFKDGDEDAEMDRLRMVLQQSEHTMSAAAAASTANNKRRRTKNKTNGEMSTTNEATESGQSNEETDQVDQMQSLLSPEMQAELGGEDSIILPPRKKKIKEKRMAAAEPTREEIKAALKERKQAERKLKQLSARSVQKKMRTELYNTLATHAIDTTERQLLVSSSSLGKKMGKREVLRQILRKERAGLELTQEEHQLLYRDRDNNDAQEVPFNEFSSQGAEADSSGAGTRKKTKESSNVEDATQNEKVKSSTSNQNKDQEMNASIESSSDDSVGHQKLGSAGLDIANNNEPLTIMEESKPTVSAPVSSTMSFAEQMMASMTSLKTQSVSQKVEMDKKEAEQREIETKEKEEREEKERLGRVVYVPPAPIVIKTPSSVDGSTSVKPLPKGNHKVLPINRPTEIEESRYDLPVSTMEYEIVDAVRNNDVTILCSETGSGKSTQVPQFLYESGFVLTDKAGEKALVAVTQPRRVAAVSTAKRVCYEMGCGDGQSIHQPKDRKGNVVAYQTRYETAGLGPNTCIKFMTDGILLQEIQTDLLLRKYNVIVLDEAHERNLNTDVLLGLLSVALPLRRKASEEDASIKPLKLIIMSATLRVQDFTENDKLFPPGRAKPAVVTVPGRTFPVTIHHSKATELDDYESIAFKKVCKIHKKLPDGGILVFLTGKQEIVRMVNKLRRSLTPRKAKALIGGADRYTGASDIGASTDILEKDSGPRSMDDDEMDGDLFQGDLHQDDFDEMEYESDESVSGETKTSSNEENDGPIGVHILPLYSMLSVEEQAKVFAAVPEGHRLIVVATNIAETSLTIPGISYVVDSGRQKCRNYHAGTGVASYDVMWISKASANQRAGRAGRTGPGHCYRLYSSSLYDRHLDQFALPEILTMPLEDVVLAMKSMNVSDVSEFPFPTPPIRAQINAAVKLLSNIGCVDVSGVEENGGDGVITQLGSAVAKLPLGVRYGKMLLIGAQANVLDYTIALVAVLSEASPFVYGMDEKDEGTDEEQEKDTGTTELDTVDRNVVLKLENEKKRERRRHWMHKGGDILAGMLAAGAYSYAGRGAGGASEALVCKAFCEENGLNFVVLSRIHKMRTHLAKLAQARLGSAEGFAAKTGGVMSSMSPPNKQQENLLKQVIVSGLLDNVARRCLPGSFSGALPFNARAAYLSCNLSMKEPLLIDQKSALYSRDSRQLPEWVCYDSIIRKTIKDGSSISLMKNLTPLDSSWLGSLSEGTQMISLGAPLTSPLPKYDTEKDAIMCAVDTKFGFHGWQVPPIHVEMFDALQNGAKQSHGILVDDSFRWFARFLLEGKVLEDFKHLPSMLNEEPAIITRRKPSSKVALIVSALSNAGIDSASALRKHWAENDNKFLFKQMKSWTKEDCVGDLKQIWIKTVKKEVESWSKEKT